MPKQRLMILGAGQCQVPIIRKAQEMGFETIVVSIAGDYPGFSVADRSYEIDVREKESICQLAQKEKICGILTDQTDIPVPTVAYVAEKMNLPGIGYDCALRFTNKYIMRKCAEHIGIPVPEYIEAVSLSQAQRKAQRLGFPLMVKPVDSQGSRGVHKVNTPDELEARFLHAKACSACGKVIMESFFQGREISAEGFVSDFRLTNLIIGDGHQFDIPDIFITSRRIYPAVMAQHLKEKIFALNRLLIQGFGLKFGITHSEYIVDDKTEAIRLAETSARGGGAFISSDLIPLVCGVNVNEWLIRLATGEPVSYAPVCLNQATAGYIYFYLPEGIVCHIQDIDDIERLPGVHKAHLQSIHLGMKVRSLTDKTSRMGPVIFKGKDRAACEAIIAQIKKQMKIAVETPEGIKGIQW